ncbi:MAG: rhodanese-like domain-containing protein [Desulfitobacteriaceae bacterium]|nr:rhodanese-like domain-containing protein [Desulfitobacteriaceae bacterium]MDI6879254.1 rhodanese-like domain-containing protein [Desulfitobacteriaceae bacterium]MDI6913734.1 rhodanese-like domain-containing protein [Desulfitobacteriaceae bacterium]
MMKLEKESKLVRTGARKKQRLTWLRWVAAVAAVLVALTGCSQPKEQAGQSGQSGTSQVQSGPTQTGPTQPDTSVPNAGTEASGVSDQGSAALPPEALVSASQLDQGIKAKQAWQIIDVREPSEFASGHVPGAFNIPLGKLEASLVQVAKDKDVILVDLNGTRSFTAWQELKSKGYDARHLKMLVGGMEQWKSLGSGEVTESIGGC